MSWGWFLSFQPSLWCVLNKWTEKKAGAGDFHFVLFCFIYLYELSTFALKMTQICQATAKLLLDAGAMLLAEGGAACESCPHPYSSMVTVRAEVGSGSALPPKNSEWEHPSKDGQGKGKCGWDLACVLFVRFMTASSTYQKWRLLSVKCSHLLDNTSCLVLKQLSHSRVSSVIRNLLGLITEIHAPTLRCLPEA